MSDAEIARLNQDFRKKSGPTDVLSFPTVALGSTRLSRRRLPAKNAGAPIDLGDIAIAPATARRYAKKQGRDVASELRVLILHGVLHLLGFDHETDNGEMDTIERKLRKRLGLS